MKNIEIAKVSPKNYIVLRVLRNLSSMPWLNILIFCTVYYTEQHGSVLYNDMMVRDPNPSDDLGYGTWSRMILYNTLPC
jgi:hypothetical protein